MTNTQRDPRDVAGEKAWREAWGETATPWEMVREDVKESWREEAAGKKVTRKEYAVQIREYWDKGFEASRISTQWDTLSPPYTLETATERVAQLNRYRHKNDTTGLPSARVVEREVTEWRPTASD